MKPARFARTCYLFAMLVAPKIDLLAPDGSVYALKASGGSADNVVATYTVNLSTKSFNGAWKLRVQDVAAGDVGTLNNWSITF